jgi:hypothetical protein
VLKRVGEPNAKVGFIGIDHKNSGVVASCDINTELRFQLSKCGDSGLFLQPGERIRKDPSRPSEAQSGTWMPGMEIVQDDPGNLSVIIMHLRGLAPEGWMASPDNRA